MGVDSRLYFPAETRVRDVAMVLSILLGAEPSRRELQGGGWHCGVSEELGVQSSSVPEMLLIAGTVAGKRVYNHWHWEGGGTIPGARLMSCGYVPARLPALRTLASFFGGTLDESDCDSSDADFVGTLRDKPYRLDAEDGAGWHALQQAMLDLADDPGRPYAWPEA